MVRNGWISFYEAVEAMGQHHISRVVLTDGAGRVRRILAGADLIRLFYH